MKLKTLLVSLSGLLYSAAAFANETAATPAAAPAASSGSLDLVGLGATLGLGIAVVGGALGQGRTAAAFQEGVSRNPAARGQLFVPMIIGLALIESLVIYALLIALIKVK